jgi:putative glutamine amidotransferase
MLRWLMTDGDRLPFFCICRGHQALNVAMGVRCTRILTGEGLDNHSSGVPMPWSSHTVELEEGSALASVTGLRKLAVNSFHHQAIKALGENLRVVARDAKGIIEAVEPVNRRGFSLSVQWHPEALAEKFPEHRSLFEAMVGAAKGGPK